MIELGPSAKSRKPEPPTYTMRDPPNNDQLQQVEPRPPTHQPNYYWFILLQSMSIVNLIRGIIASDHSGLFLKIQPKIFP